MCPEKISFENDSRITSGMNFSYWLSSTDPISYTPLQSNEKVDAVIVGGGIAGLTSAYLLLKEGKKVAVIEDGNIGSGESGRTSAHLSNAFDDRYSEVAHLLGREAAKHVAESHTKAIDLIEKIVREESIDCDFERVDGYLFLHPSDKTKTLEDEYKAAKKVGIDVEQREGVPGIPLEKGLTLVFRNQAQFHPLKYLRGLSVAIVKRGGKIYTDTHASDIRRDGITADNGYNVEAECVVVATNTPVNDRVVMHTKQAAYRTYIIGAKIPKGSVPKALYWDTGNVKSKWPTEPYHYVRTQSLDEHWDLLIVGGEDHKTGQAIEEEGIRENERYKALEQWTRERFPIHEIVYHWSGQVMEPVDDVAFIGRNPLRGNNQFIITGDSGNGLTHGTLGAILVTDLIMGRENPWEKTYDPSRKNVRTLKDYAIENGNVLKHLKDYFTPGDLETIAEITPGEGSILREGRHKAAVYRDTTGTVHAYSAICPHLKCVVHWNNEEKTFDCPCHGSRFDCHGEVMNGPANMGLSPLSAEVEDRLSEKPESTLRPGP